MSEVKRQRPIHETAKQIVILTAAKYSCGTRKIIAIADTEEYLTEEFLNGYSAASVRAAIKGMLRKEIGKALALHIGMGYYDVTPLYWDDKVATSSKFATMFTKQGKVDAALMFADEAQEASKILYSLPEFPTRKRKTRLPMSEME